MTHHAPIRFEEAAQVTTPDLQEVVIQRIIRRSDLVSGVWRRDRLYRRPKGSMELPRVQ